MSQQKQQNEPSGAAMEAAEKINDHVKFIALDEDCARAIDLAMQPEREAAEKMAEWVKAFPCRCPASRTETNLRSFNDRCDRCRLLAAYEAARGK